MYSSVVSKSSSINARQLWRRNDAAFAIYIGDRTACEALRGAPLLPPDSTLPCSLSLCIHSVSVYLKHNRLRFHKDPDSARAFRRGVRKFMSRETALYSTLYQ